MTIVALSPDEAERFWPKVEKTETCWNWTAALNTSGYGVFKCRRRMMRAHRLTYSTLRGPIPEGMQIDHMCHNKACVNPGHLRLASHKQNQENRTGAQSNSKSGVRGVGWDEQLSRWCVQVKHRGRNHNGGRYLTLAEAENAATELRNHFFTHNLADR